MCAVQVIRFCGPEVPDIAEPGAGSRPKLHDVSTARVNYADTHHSLSQDSPQFRPTPGLAPVFCGTDACYTGALTDRLGSASRDLSAVIGKYAHRAVIAPWTTS